MGEWRPRLEEAWLPRRVRVHPGSLSGSLRVPGSKSYSHRALLAALLSARPSRLTGILWSLDTVATLDAVERLGGRVEGDPAGSSVRIEPPRDGLRWTPCIDAGESGTTMRLVTGILGLLEDTVLVYGRGRLHARPVKPLLEAMQRLGVSYTVSRGCCPPHALHGPAAPGETLVDAGQSSQYLSALLLLGAGLGSLDVRVTRLESKGYVDITVRVLESFGVRVEREGYSWFRVEGQPRGANYSVPGDWSSGAQLVSALAAAGGSITLQGLDPGDPHPDRGIVDILAGAGVECRWASGSLACSSPGPGGLEAFHTCLRDSPDLAPGLAAVAAVACGVSRLCCVERLRLKESDRVEAVLDLARRAGAEAWLEKRDGSLCVAVRGLCGRPRGGIVYNSHGDHRVAMAAASLLLASKQSGVVEEANVVAKSYPLFWLHLKTLGARVEEA